MLTQGLGWREDGWGEAGLWGVPAMPGVPGCPGRRADSRLAKARFMGGADEKAMTRTGSCRCGICPAVHTPWTLTLADNVRCDWTFPQC